MFKPYSLRVSWTLPYLGGLGRFLDRASHRRLRQGSAEQAVLAINGLNAQLALERTTLVRCLAILYEAWRDGGDETVAPCRADCSIHGASIRNVAAA